MFNRVLMKNISFISLQIISTILSTIFFSVAISEYSKLEIEIDKYSNIFSSIIIIYVLNLAQILLYNGFIVYIVKKEHKSKDRIRNGYKRWLAHMCYSIRSPVHTINYLSDTIVNQHRIHGSPEPEKMKLLNASINQLYDVVNSYVDFTAIETNNIVIKKKNMNLLEVVNVVFEQYQIINTEIKMKLDFDNLFRDVEIFSDPLKIRQILSTALHNSTKFTYKGEITLKIRKRTNNFIEFSVKDTGPGLKGKEEKIIDSKTGLGLLISKYTAEALGGSIKLQNRQDGQRGAEFILSIPHEEIKQRSPDEIPFRLPRMFSDVIVFACEDNSSHRYTLKEMFLQFGIKNRNIKIFSDGENMVEYMKGDIKKPHIIILDIFMKRMNGDELYDHIRELGYTAPIIANTANVYNNQKYLDQGFEKVLNKPYKGTDLKEVIKQSLNFGLEIV